MKFAVFAGLFPVVLMLSGCTWFCDNRPEPVGTPYDSAVQPKDRSYSSDEAVNAAVSAISLRMAVSSQGPFRVIPKKKVTVLGFRIIDSLSRMRLSRPSAPHILFLEDSVTEGAWTFVLSYPDEREFLRKSLKLKGYGNGQK